MRLLENKISHFIIFLSVLLFVFRDLFFSLKTNLIDLRDYPLMLWIISQNVLKIQSLNFVNYFDTTAFFPHKYTLLFSDLLLPQSLIALPFFLFSDNLTLIFNLVFLLTFILNFIALYLFWKILFKNNLISFFGSLFVIFSPYFHLELPHFQMLSYWPFFLGLYFLFKSEDGSIRNVFFCGLFLAIQFLASVYLSVYLIFSIVFYLISRVIFSGKLKNILKIFLIIFITFLIIDGVFIKGYTDIKDYYSIQRGMNEYINYSAHLSDYVFTSTIRSLFHQSNIMDFWNRDDKNNSLGKASFPGFLITFLAFYSLIKFVKNREKVVFTIQLDKTRFFFIVIIIAGLIFSLGPRLNFNGNYVNIPLPYSLMLEVVPFLDAVRSPARWSFIFYIGVIYFALLTLKKLKKNKYYLFFFVFFFLIFVLEYIPTKLVAEKGYGIGAEYNILKDICIKEKKVLLEIPITHLNAAPDVATGLTYINQVQLSSIFHQCNLVNGYSGYDLPDNFVLADTLNNYIINGDVSGFISELRKRDINFVKFNSKYFSKELQKPLNSFLKGIIYEKGVEKIGQDIYKISN